MSGFGFLRALIAADRLVCTTLAGRSQIVSATPLTCGAKSTLLRFCNTYKIPATTATAACPVSRVKRTFGVLSRVVLSLRVLNWLPRRFMASEYQCRRIELVSSTREQIEHRGFSILPSMFSKDQAEALCRDLENSELKRTKAGIRHALQHETIRNLAGDKRLLNIAREMLGHEAFPFRATLFDKSPQANWLVVWHQDTALPFRQRHEPPAGAPGPSRAELRMHTHRQRLFRKFWPFVFTLTTPTQRTGRSGYYHALT